MRNGLWTVTDSIDVMSYMSTLDDLYDVTTGEVYIYTILDYASSAVVGISPPLQLLSTTVCLGESMRVVSS
jgi:hypothetical protein